MNPPEHFCHTHGCWAYGRPGEGHVVIHRQRARRSRGQRCRRPCRATKGTALDRVPKPTALVGAVVTLLAHGGPLQAIGAAVGLDERTVTRWQAAAGAQCRRRHEPLVQAGRVELGQGQADELRGRGGGGVVGLASAVVVASRLWLGGVVGAPRDGGLIRAWLARVRACGARLAVLLCTDGLASCGGAARRGFREPVRTGGRGRPRLVLPAGVLLAPAVKRRAKRRVVGVERRIVRGRAAAGRARLVASPGKPTAVLNTAFVERLTATFRARLAPLARRPRAAGRQAATLEAGMWLVGTV